MDLLQMEREKRDADKKEEPLKIKRNVDPTIKMIDKSNLTPDHIEKLPQEDRDQYDFLCYCEMGDFTPKIDKENNAQAFLDDEREGGPINVRMQDEKGEMALHKVPCRHEGPSAGMRARIHALAFGCSPAFVRSPRMARPAQLGPLR